MEIISQGLNKLTNNTITDKDKLMRNSKELPPEVIQLIIWNMSMV